MQEPAETSWIVFAALNCNCFAQDGLRELSLVQLDPPSHENS
jgi:hypothetical protein